MFERSVKIGWSGQDLILDGNRVLYWAREQLLVVADLHLGKAEHFQRHGIPIPSQTTGDTVGRLSETIASYSPRSIFLLGDIFHSSRGDGADTLDVLMDTFQGIDWKIFAGNHDRRYLSRSSANSLVIEDSLTIEPFVFSHGDRERITPKDRLSISGHIHPGITIRGRGGLSERVACFHLTRGSLVLPAFGDFTGTATISRSVGDRVFGVVGGGVVEI